MTNIFEAMRVFMGSAYVNDFNMFGRTYRVTAQADGDYRLDQESVSKIRVRNADGDMVPLGSLVTFQEIAGPERVPRYNLFPSAEVQGAARPGISSGQALQIMRALAQEKLPPGVNYEWTDLSFQEAKVGRTGYYIFVLSVIFVFLALSAQYESWSLPLAILLIVPMCLFSAAFGVWLHGREINILTQIGFVVLIALAAKNVDPDRGVRAAVGGAGQGHHLGRGGSLPAAAAAHHHDVAGVHAGRGAALPGGRGGRGDAHRARHGGVLGHDRRDAVRPDLHAGVLRGHPPAGGHQAGRAGAKARGAGSRRVAG